jgi:hypothetical protein
MMVRSNERSACFPRLTELNCACRLRIQLCVYQDLAEAPELITGFAVDGQGITWGIPAPRSQAGEDAR